MSKEIHPSPWDVPLTDEQFSLIGRITVSLSMTEMCLDNALDLASGTLNAQKQRILTGDAPISAKLHILKRLCKVSIPEPDCTNIRKACDDIARLLPIRNKIIHGQWGEYTVDGVTRVGTYSLKDPTKPFDSEDLSSFLSDLNKAGLKLFKAIDAMLGFDNSPPFRLAFQAKDFEIPTDQQKALDIYFRIKAISARRKLNKSP